MPFFFLRRSRYLVAKLGRLCGRTRLNLLPVYAEVALDGGDDDHNVFANLWAKEGEEKKNGGVHPGVISC